MTATVQDERAQQFQRMELEGHVAEYLLFELTSGLGPSGVQIATAEEYDDDDPDGPILVRFKGQRYELEIEVFARPVPEPLTPEQKAEQRAREERAAVEASMVPLFDAGGA